jgi:alpha-L-arabinofuranosidase
MGHPASFNLKYLGVGNEQWDEQYIERYKEFDKVLRVKHPEIQLVSGSGPSSDGPRFDYAWKELTSLKTDLIDEHYYRNPEWFFANANRYDKYDRKGPKVFAGEYAAHSKDSTDPESRNTWLSALAEASFMTGLERNADIVEMASYAPLLAHVEAWQWRPDLIWFDNLRAVGTPNYYVQKLFSVNKGTHVVPVLSNGQVLAGKDSIYASATIDRKTNTLNLKIVNSSNFTKTFDIKLEGVTAVKEGIVQSLTSAEPFAFNTLDKPQIIVPVSSPIKKTGNKIKVEVKPVSVNVVSLPLINK